MPFNTPTELRMTITDVHLDEDGLTPQWRVTASNPGGEELAFALPFDSPPVIGGEVLMQYRVEVMPWEVR